MSKKSNKIKLEYFREMIVPDLFTNRINWEEFNPSCFRLTDGINVVDYYPISNKLFIHKDEEWRENIDPKELVKIITLL